jgi:hypothetical protein
LDQFLAIPFRLIVKFPVLMGRFGPDIYNFNGKFMRRNAQRVNRLMR